MNLPVLSVAQLLSLMTRAALLALETATYDAEDFDRGLADAISREKSHRFQTDKEVIENARLAGNPLDHDARQALMSGAW